MPAGIDEVVRFLHGTALRHPGGEPTDGQLLGRFVASRDQAALAALVRRHGPMVWGVCRRILRGHHDAEDAFQATFLVLVRKAPSVRRPEAVANWLYGVARQTARKARAALTRRRTRESQVAALPETEAPPQTDPRTDLRPLLDEALSRLPEKYRTALVLCDLEGRTRKEGARQLGLPEGTLAGHLTRGRALLARRLARYGLAVSGGAFAAALSPVAAAGVPAAGVLNPASAVPAKVAALTQGVLKAMLLSELKRLTVLLAAVLTLGAGAAGLWTQAARAVQGPPGAPAAAPGKAPGAREDDQRDRGAPVRVPVAVVLGPKAFRDGDVIEITAVRATSPKLEQGDSVTVRGRFRLASRDQAELALFLTQTEGDGGDETDASQVVRVKRGGGDFELRATIRHRGVLHLTLYDERGWPFGGVYFGTAAQMKRIEGWSLDYYLL